ncbi:MAG TPA: TolC family protein [Vicinamibacterales bacterium]|jgi:cobalt-zinc-cadmium efflux system outer membrane protein|nr:TolC family protein [Vicinamibacterales bacterium]
MNGRRAPDRAAHAPLLAYLAIVIGVLSGSPLHAQQSSPTPALTVEAAVQKALAANRALQSARLSLPVAAADVQIARERPNPDFLFETERETPKQAVGLSLPIELGHKRQARIALADASSKVAEADVARTEADIENDVRRAYYTAVAADRRVALSEEIRGLAQRLRDTAATRAQAGDVAELEVVQLTIGVLEADQDVSAARGDAAAARADLDVLLGEPSTASFTLTDDLTAAPLPALPGVLARVAEANSTLLGLERRITEQTARRDVAASLKVPDLNVSGSVTYLAMPEFRVGWRASAGMTVPLFSSHTAGVTREDAELARIRAERDATRIAIDSAVTVAFVRAAAVREQVLRFNQEILPALERADSMIQEGYTAGHTPLVTVLAALRQSRESRAKGLQAALDYQLALTDLERAAGTRLP